MYRIQQIMNDSPVGLIRECAKSTTGAPIRVIKKVKLKVTLHGRITIAEFTVFSYTLYDHIIFGVD